MSKFIDLTGRTFSFWTVIKKTNKGERVYWECRCVCGKTRAIAGNNLVASKSKSCGCNGNRVKPGQIFGKLTAKEVIGEDKSYLTLWLCVCSCGGTRKAKENSLRQGHTASCGCISSPDLSGKVFGELLVIGRNSKTKRSNQLWLCKCKCGKMVRFTSASLNYGTSKNCGVSCGVRSEMAPIKFFYNTYKGSAKCHGRKFNLTIEEFREIVVQPCHYCGHKGVERTIPMKKAIESRRKQFNTRNVKLDLTNMSFISNGIDRVDSSADYVKENCVPCCRPCNIAKLNKSSEDFINHAYSIVAHQEKLKDRK